MPTLIIIRCASGSGVPDEKVKQMRDNFEPYTLT